MELSDFLSMTAGVSTTDELIEANRSSLDEAARAYLIYQAIAEDAGIEATTEEAASYILDTTGSSDFEVYAQVYGLPYLKLGALMDEVTNMLVDGATVE